MIRHKIVIVRVRGRFQWQIRDLLSHSTSRRGTRYYASAEEARVDARLALAKFQSGSSRTAKSTAAGNSQEKERDVCDVAQTDRSAVRDDAHVEDVLFGSESARNTHKDLRRRRGAHDSAIYGPGHELGRARRPQPCLEDVPQDCYAGVALIARDISPFRSPNSRTSMPSWEISSAFQHATDAKRAKQATSKEAHILAISQAIEHTSKALD
jgi:hypothetical protein